MRRLFAPLLLSFLMLTACSSAAVRATHVTVVTLGATVTTLRTTNARLYEDATNHLITDLSHDGGTPADYDREVAPITREFLARSAALVSLDAALYAAAGITDAVRAGGSLAAVRGAAGEVLVATDRLLDVLATGTLLPPVAIPPEVRALLVALRTIAGASPDGGYDGGRD